jgi:plasmid maintenance system killer protein
LFSFTYSVKLYSLQTEGEVDISFRANSLRRDLNESARLRKRYGPEMAEVIRQRLDDLRAARSLADMRNLPGRCHELTGGRAGQLSLDLRGPFRLLFRAAHRPVPVREDGGLDWSRVTAVEIGEVQDTHGYKAKRRQ